MWSALSMAYDKPNSIAYYPSTKAYFISNLAGKSITLLDSNFDKREIITGLIRPKDILFATFGSYNGLLILDSNEVKVYDADGYSYIATFKVPGAMDLEDAELDKTKSDVFYMSDPTANKIYKVVVGCAPFYIPTISILDSTVRRPKALLFDRKNRLLVTTDTIKSAVYNINLINGTATIIQTTSIDYINSIEEDIQGNFYASSWGDSYFYRLDKNFKNAVGLAQYSKPTGLYFNKTDDVIVLACSNCNKIEFHKLHMVYLNDVDTAKCPGDSFNVNSNIQFKGKGTYNAGNIFYVELSDGNGSFSSATLVCSIKTSAEPNTYRVAMPFNKRFYGANYKIRIRSTNPVFYSLNELQTVVPYIPTLNLSNQDTVLFCKPATLIFGNKVDLDSGFVKYLWYENGKKISNSLPTYQNTLTAKTKLLLIKSPLSGQCLLKDSILLIPSSTINIPFEDTIKACENTWINIGGDSIENTKIEWASKKYPNIRTEYNPKYQLNFSDTFSVTVSSTGGGCTSQKNIYAFAISRPQFINDFTHYITCSLSGVWLVAALKVNRDHIKYSWDPSNYLNASNWYYANFINAPQGNYAYKLKAIDSISTCYDSIVYTIRNIETPIKPILGVNDKGVVIKNYDMRFTYKWYKDSVFVNQIANDSQFVVPNGSTNWGDYWVIATNTDSVDCIDTSYLFTLKDPGSIYKSHKHELAVYPNPSHDKLFIKNFMGNLEEAEASVYNCFGQNVLIQNPSAKGEINISNLIPGVYFISVNFEGKLFTSVFIKKE